MQIPMNEIIIEPTSGVDDVGRVFWWKNEIYRGIYSPYAQFYKNLFSSSLGNKLVEIGLIPTEIVPYQVNGFELVLKHKTVRSISYVTEWSSAMIKDAALLTCDIQLCLLEYDYTLKDAHPWNVLYDACTPRWVDVGSISEMSPSRLAFFYYDFRSTFLYPLLLKRGNISPIVNATMSTHLGVPMELSIYRILFLLIPIYELFYHRRQERRIGKTLQKSPISAIQQLRKQVEAIPNSAYHTEWASYPYLHPSVEDKAHWSCKDCTINELLEKLCPRSVLDIGTNKGWYAQLAESKGARVVSIDVDELSINELYCRAKTLNLNISPMLLDICMPTLVHGLWGIYRAAQERLKSEMVMMLALMHHLVQKRHRTLADIAYYLSSFAEKWAVVEFVGPQDVYVRSWDRIQSSGYTLSGFQSVLNQYFSEVNIFGQIDDNRWIILCTR